MQRRHFIKALSGTVILLANGNILKAGIFPDKKVVLRFAVASDGHFGEKNTSYLEYYQSLVTAVNNFHNGNPLDAIVVNGDIIHDKPEFLTEAATALQGLHVPLYVTRGNHDRVSAATWQETWKIPLNHSVVIKEQVFLLGDTSNESGDYLPPDLDFFKTSLKQHKKANNIFIFLHITPVTWTKHGVDATDFQKLIGKQKNIRAIFNGHDHDQDNVKMLGQIPFLFDGHFGGSWGTTHRGFRVVELMEDNSIHSYLLDPVNKINYFDAI